MTVKTTAVAGVLCSFCSLLAAAQSPSDMAALKGLAPVAILSNTLEGRAALAANYTVTGTLQTGLLGQSTLLPFAEQEQQALKDVFITRGNLAQLADGLGTTLGAAYVARAHYVDRTNYTSVSRSIADVIAYADATSSANSDAGKYFFANLTADGKKPVSASAVAVLNQLGGHSDMFGGNYGRPAGTPGANAYGDSRPFQTEPGVSLIIGSDYFSQPSDNGIFSRGPMINSPSYPSGHTTYGYTGALVLALLLPERYQQMVVRGAEYGNGRILVGAHYAMDVLGARTLALYDMAHLLANDPAYVGHAVNGAPAIENFRDAIVAAHTELTRAMEAVCGKDVKDCAREDIGRFNNPAVNEAFYTSTQTYSLPDVYPKNITASEDVSTLAPEAGYLLTVAFPALTLTEANRILTETEGPGGGFLDDGSPFGVYSRINLYTAAGKAAALMSQKASLGHRNHLN